MKKKVTVLLMLLFLLTIPAVYPAFAEYFWDAPHYLLRQSRFTRYSDVKIVRFDGNFFIFLVVREKKQASLQFYTTDDFKTFMGPFSAVERVRVEEGFFPQYSVLAEKNALLVAWNTLKGSIDLKRSTDGGKSWNKAVTVIDPKTFNFRPSLFAVDDTLCLFYHTEGEGRRIDFFYLFSTDNGITWEGPFQPISGFAGSFFPILLKFDHRYRLIWQSRSLETERTPVFDIYISNAADLQGPWSNPVNLTDNPLAEDENPHVLIGKKGFTLIWESDAGGIWSVYWREFDKSGNPVSDAVKINKTLANARGAKLLSAEGSLYVFYIDDRDGRNRLYYAKRRDGDFKEFGPIDDGVDIIEQIPVTTDDSLYAFWNDGQGIAYNGPDLSVLPVRIESPARSYIGVAGLPIVWKPLSDPSGIKGYGYLFNRNKKDVPEFINLSPHITSILLQSGEEGNYYFHIIAEDGAGNVSDTVTVGFVVDLTPPPAPEIRPLKQDKDGYYSDNSPVLSWSAAGADIAGYTYKLSKNRVNLHDPVIRTEKKTLRFRQLEGGTWYFNIAAVDRAGNMSRTAHVTFRLKPLAKEVERQKGPVIQPPWAVTQYRTIVQPVLNIMLYIVLCGLGFVVFYITAEILRRYFPFREEAAMKKDEAGLPIRSKRLGLRFKFSILIGVLVLLLTVGISLVMSIVNIAQERRALAHQMMDKASLSVENMTNVAREGILNNDQLLLLSVISKTMENRDINYSIIFDTSRKVIAHSDINEQGKILTDSFSLAASQAKERLVSPGFSPDSLAPIYDIASPVFFAGKRIGTVRLGYSTQSIFETIDAARRKNLINTILITAATILIGIAGAIVMASITIKPIKILAKGANIVGGGDLHHEIKLKARDEIGLLADEFNRMTARLLVYQKEMEEKAKIDEQLDIARRIQQDLIPQTGIDTDALWIEGFYKAAAGVGGDYYDFIEMGSGQYGLIMSDVAGKGVPASLMMIMIRTVFKSLIKSGISNPARMVTLMNSTLASEISSDRFATLLFGVVNTADMIFRYTNAGYGPLMVYKAQKNGCFLVSPTGNSVPIGVMPDIRYSEENQIKLERGDALILFTDGIHEARNSSGREYGMKRMADIIPGFAENHAKEIANRIIEDVSGFVGDTEQYDDMTLLVMKLK